MESSEQNQLLTQVGRGTPMGELMRRFWRSKLVEEMLERGDGQISKPEGLSPEYGLHKQGYKLSDVQAQRILEMRLQNLTALESELNAATPSPARASEHTNMILKECAGMSSMPAKGKPHPMD